MTQLHSASKHLEPQIQRLNERIHRNTELLRHTSSQAATTIGKASLKTGSSILADLTTSIQSVPEGLAQASPILGTGFAALSVRSSIKSIASDVKELGNLQQRRRKVAQSIQEVKRERETFQEMLRNLIAQGETVLEQESEQLAALEILETILDLKLSYLKYAKGSEQITKMILAQLKLIKEGVSMAAAPLIWGGQAVAGTMMLQSALPVASAVLLLSAYLVASNYGRAMVGMRRLSKARQNLEDATTKLGTKQAELSSLRTAQKQLEEGKVPALDDLKTAMDQVAKAQDHFTQRNETRGLEQRKLTEANAQAQITKHELDFKVLGGKVRQRLRQIYRKQQEKVSELKGRVTVAKSNVEEARQELQEALQHQSQVLELTAQNPPDPEELQARIERLKAEVDDLKLVHTAMLEQLQEAASACEQKLQADLLGASDRVVKETKKELRKALALGRGERKGPVAEKLRHLLLRYDKTTIDASFDQDPVETIFRFILN